MWGIFRRRSQNDLLWRKILRRAEQSDAPESETALSRAAAAISSGDHPSLALASEEIILLSEKLPYLIKPLIIIADHLAQNPEHLSQAIAIFRHIARRGNYNRKVAVNIVKYAPALPTASDRIDAYRDALRCRDPLCDADLDDGIVALILKDADEFSEISDRISAFRDAARMVYRGARGRYAAAGFVQNVKKLPDASYRFTLFEHAHSLERTVYNAGRTGRLTNNA
jgi:hypothetical protein